MLAITTAAPPEEGPKTDIPLNLPAAKDLPEHLDLTGLDETGLERVRVKYEQGKTDLVRTPLVSIYYSALLICLPFKRMAC